MDHTDHLIVDYLSRRCGKPVRLTFTDNVMSMASFRDAKDGTVIIRLHRMFRKAPEEILDALADWIRHPRSRQPSIREFMDRNRDEVRETEPRQRPPWKLYHKGRHHDLAASFARLNAQYFNSRLEMRITWGKKPRKRYPRNITLGTYCQETKVITISPRLDRRNVPQYFVDYVIYHEMLHAALGVEEGENGRRRVHTRQFKKMEESFHDFQRAEAFQSRFFG